MPLPRPKNSLRSWIGIVAFFLVAATAVLWLLEAIQWYRYPASNPEVLQEVRERLLRTATIAEAGEPIDGHLRILRTLRDPQAVRSIIDRLNECAEYRGTRFFDQTNPAYLLLDADGNPLYHIRFGATTRSVAVKGLVLKDGQYMAAPGPLIGESGEHSYGDLLLWHPDFPQEMSDIFDTESTASP